MLGKGSLHFLSSILRGPNILVSAHDNAMIGQRGLGFGLDV